MNSLRVKVMALLIAAITIVLVTATIVTALILNAPKTSLLVDHVTAQVGLISSLLSAVPYAESSRISTTTHATETIAGNIDPDSTALLRAALRRSGSRASVTIYNQPGGFGQLASIAVADGRTVVIPIGPITFPAPPWIALASWMALVLIGMIIVAVLTANWVTRPLALLQSIVSAVDEKGVLPTLNEEGPAEIRATASAINLLSANLRRAMESRMRLVAAAGHDLRTPMTRMRLRAEFIQDDNERHPWLRDIAELDRIADSAIGLVREEVSDAQGERVELNELVAGLLADLNDMGFDIHSTQLESVAISAGPMALTRALRNLFINAATHGKGALVRLARDARGGSITIEDRGPGIPDHLIARVFEPFFRVDFARHQSIPGAGLGLAIAKEIIEKYGGTIVLTNLPAGGLSQRITFPAT